MTESDLKGRLERMKASEGDLRMAEARIQWMMREHEREGRLAMFFAALTLTRDALGDDWFVNDLHVHDEGAYCALVQISAHHGIAYAGRIPPQAEGRGETAAVAVARAIRAALASIRPDGEDALLDAQAALRALAPETRKSLFAEFCSDCGRETWTHAKMARSEEWCRCKDDEAD